MHCFNTFTFWEGLRLDYRWTHKLDGLQVSTPLPSGKVCDRKVKLDPVRYTLDVSTPLPSGKVCDPR